MASRKRLLKQAALESLVRFGPQLDALDQLVSTAKGTYKQTVGAANVSAASTRQAVKDARPDIKKTYDEAGLSQATLNDTLLGHDLAGLSGAGVDTIKAGAAAEAHMMATHLNEAKVQALQELTNRGLQADAGRAQAVLQAGQTLHGDLADIGRSRESIAGQAGAFQAATLGDLLETRAGRQFTARQNRLSREAAKANNEADNATSTANTKARIDAAAAKDARTKNKGLLSNGVKRATPGQHGAARDSVELALTQAKRLKASGRDRKEIAQLLVEGRSPQTIDDGNGGKVKVPGVSKVPQLLSTTALDILYNHGRVSARTRRLLNARGLTVKGMGFKGPMTAAEKRRQDAAIARQLKRNRKKTGQAVPLL